MANRNALSAWLIIIIIVLTGLSGYLWYDRSQIKKELTNSNIELEEVEKVQTELEIEYDRALASLDEMKTDNVELNSLIDEQKNELKSQKNKISGLIWSKNKLEEARQEIASLKAQTNSYISEIQNLKQKNQSLVASNEKLTIEKESLTDNLNLVKTEKEELSESKAKLMSEKESLIEENTELSSKVTVASAIKVDQIVATGYAIKASGKLAEKKRAKAVDQVRVCFDLEDNLIADQGEEEFYLRIIDPVGETIAIESMGSGVLVESMENLPVRYTKKSIVNYENRVVNACIDWNPGVKFMKGEYDVEIYNKGFLVGKSNFKFK